MKKTMLLCIRNGLMSDGIVSMITRKNISLNVFEERNPELFCTSAEIYNPDVVVIEVKGIRPYTLAEWSERVDKMQKALPKCKVAMIVDDESFPETAEVLKKVKARGEIDAFFYTSSGLNYLVDVMDSL